MEKVISWIHSCKTSEQLDVTEKFIEKRFEGMEFLELKEAIESQRQKVCYPIWAEMMLSA